MKDGVKKLHALAVIYAGLSVPDDPEDEPVVDEDDDATKRIMADGLDAIPWVFEAAVEHRLDEVGRAELILGLETSARSAPESAPVFALFVKRVRGVQRRLDVAAGRS